MCEQSYKDANKCESGLAGSVTYYPNTSAPTAPAPSPPVVHHIHGRGRHAKEGICWVRLRPTRRANCQVHLGGRRAKASPRVAPTPADIPACPRRSPSPRGCSPRRRRSVGDICAQPVASTSRSTRERKAAAPKEVRAGRRRETPAKGRTTPVDLPAHVSCPHRPPGLRGRCADTGNAASRKEVRGNDHAHHTCAKGRSEHYTMCWS